VLMVFLVDDHGVVRRGVGDVNGMELVSAVRTVEIGRCFWTPGPLSEK
jgi:hypothetical protein